MSRSEQLRVQRAGTVINEISKDQDKILKEDVVPDVIDSLHTDFPGIQLTLNRIWRLNDIVEHLRISFPDVDFADCGQRSHMRPDGGVVMLERLDGLHFPVLISECKNQGTNKRRLAEGKPRQAMGNAVERLGKNVIGMRTAMLQESVFPFVCFGNGEDFEEGSSIRDRVATIAMFGELNKTYLHVQSDKFNRGSFYFREEEWTGLEMFDIAYDIAEKSIYYYFSKYGRARFIHKVNDA